MRVGLISDIHFSYSHGNKTAASGANQREQDVYDAAFAAVTNLCERNVDVILDLGDMAHVPLPRKRAMLQLIGLIKYASIPFYSANGNHTLQRSSTDVHLYSLLANFADNFRGYTEPGITPFGAYLIPYGNDEEIKAALDQMPSDATMVAGHWAAEDVPFPGAHVPLSELPSDIPVFLGHYHTRQYNGFGRPFYIGATERYSWGEATNPTGVAIFDTSTGAVEFFDHPTRPWIDIRLTPDDYLEDAHYEHIEDAIVRVTVTASAAQYHSLDLVAVKKKLTGSLEYQLRRGQLPKEQQQIRTKTVSLLEGWRQHITEAKIPRGISRKEVEQIGTEAIGAAGG